MVFHRLRALCLALLCALAFIGCDSSQRRLQNALRLEREYKFEAAIIEYGAVAGELRSSAHAGRAQALAVVEQHLGECYWKLGRGAESLTAFQKSLDYDAGNPTTHLRISEVLLAGGDAEHAADEAVNTLRLDPNNIEALTILSVTNIDKGLLAPAKILLNKVLALDAGNVNASIALAGIEQQQQHLDTAGELLHAAGERHPTDPDPWLVLGRMEEQAGAPADAERAYRRAATAKDSAETNIRLAQFLARSSRLGEAQAVLQHVDQISSSEQPGTSSGDFQLLSGHPDQARDSYSGHLPPSGGERLLQQNRTALVARMIEAALESAAQSSVDERARAASLNQARLLLTRYQR